AVPAAPPPVAAALAAREAHLRGEGREAAADIASPTRLRAGAPALRAAVDAAVAAGTPADTAIAEAVETQAQVLASLPDPTLAGRAADVRAVGRRLLARLAGEAGATQAGHPDPARLAPHGGTAHQLPA